MIKCKCGYAKMLSPPLEGVLTEALKRRASYEAKVFDAAPMQGKHWRGSVNGFPCNSAAGEVTEKTTLSETTTRGKS